MTHHVDITLNLNVSRIDNPLNLPMSVNVNTFYAADEDEKDADQIADSPKLCCWWILYATYIPRI